MAPDGIHGRPNGDRDDAESNDTPNDAATQSKQERTPVSPDPTEVSQASRKQRHPHDFENSFHIFDTGLDPTKKRRNKRPFTAEERAIIAAKRKIGVCGDCHRRKIRCIHPHAPPWFEATEYRPPEYVATSEETTKNEAFRRAEIQIQEFGNQYNSTHERSVDLRAPVNGLDYWSSHDKELFDDCYDSITESLELELELQELFHQPYSSTSDRPDDRWTIPLYQDDYQTTVSSGSSKLREYIPANSREPIVAFPLRVRLPSGEGLPWDFRDGRQRTQPRRTIPRTPSARVHPYQRLPRQQRRRTNHHQLENTLNTFVFESSSTDRTNSLQNPFFNVQSSHHQTVGTEPVEESRDVNRSERIDLFTPNSSYPFPLSQWQYAPGNTPYPPLNLQDDSSWFHSTNATFQPTTRHYTSTLDSPPIEIWMNQSTNNLDPAFSDHFDEDVDHREPDPIQFPYPQPIQFFHHPSPAPLNPTSFATGFADTPRGSPMPSFPNEGFTSSAVDTHNTIASTPSNRSPSPSALQSLPNFFDDLYLNPNTESTHADDASVSQSYIETSIYAPSLTFGSSDLNSNAPVPTPAAMRTLDLLSVTVAKKAAEASSEVEELCELGKV